MADIIHRIGIKSSAEKVFKAISTIKGLANWWTNEVEGDENTGGKIKFRFRSEQGDVKGEMIMEVQELELQKSVKWLCLQGPDEWVGTTLTFQLTEADGQIIMMFGHRNWKEPVEFMAHCSMKWAVFLLSLREYVETGKGHPSPYDLKIDNWN